MRFLYSLLFMAAKPLVALGGFALPSGMTILAALAAIVVPVAATWYYLKIDHASEMAAAVANERHACTLKINQIQDTLHEDLLSKLARARQAEESVVEPKTDAELLDICKRSASCRDR